MCLQMICPSFLSVSLEDLRSVIVNITRSLTSGEVIFFLLYEKPSEPKIKKMP